MSSGLRKSAFLVTTVALLSILAVGVTPAGADHTAGAGAIVFRGVATAVGLCYPGVHVVRPECGASGLPGAEHTYQWSLDLFTQAGQGLDFCVAVDAGASPPIGATHQTAGNIGGTSCDSVSSGTGAGALYLNGNPVGSVHPGGWCGLSSGFGGGTVTVNTHGTFDNIQWITSAATVLPIEDGNLGNNVVTAGVVDAVGSTGGGNCGATAVSVGFNVVGALTSVRRP